jgi:AraC-like DNA-binding protein
MKATYEKISGHDSSLVVFERSDPAFPFYWHYHPEYELTLIVDSSGQRTVGDSIAMYGPGDLVLLGPNLPHSWCSLLPQRPSREPHRAVVAQFRHDCFGEAFFKMKELSDVARLLEQSAGGLAFGHTDVGHRVAAVMVDLPHLRPPERVARFLVALADLSQVEKPLRLSTSPMRPKSRPTDQHRIDAICSYLTQHSSEEIDYAELTRRSCMEQASLCRFFKRITGRTITTYVNEVRIATAAQLLIDSNQSILDIGFQVGFGNYSNFNRQFRRLKGMGPQTFRNRVIEQLRVDSTTMAGAGRQTD